MFKKFLFLFFAITICAQAQYSVKGTLEPMSDYEWVILYQLKSSAQNYIANGTLEKGSFELKFPKNAESGMYRLAYDLENNGYIDFLYNSENIELSFDPKLPLGTLKFKASNENKIYSEYLLKSEISQQQLDSLQVVYFRIQDKVKQQEVAGSFNKIVKNINEIQEMYESLSKEKLANSFIKANRKHIADSIFKSPQEYLNSIKDHYFDYIDFSNKSLYNSTYFSEKIIDYVFFLNSSEDYNVQQQLFKSSVEDVLSNTGDNNYIKSEILTVLMSSFAQIQNIEMVTYVIDKHYLKLPEEFINKKTIETVREKVKLAIGVKAPDFSWDKNGAKVWLSKLNIAKKYILVFWSTTCSHCLNEIPQLYEFTKDKEEIHVIAFAMENDEKGFNHHTKNFPKWTNILGLEKWDNKISREYEINSTPTYFILNSAKEIIAKPEYFTDVKSFFNE